MTAERNMYENVAFGDGRIGHIQMKSGGEQATKPEDTIVVNEAGVMMHHGDEFDTVTFIPMGNIAWVRTRGKVSNKSKVRSIVAHHEALPSADETPCQ